MENTKEEILEKYKKLPKDIQEVITSEEFGFEIQIIGKEVGITPTQALDVEDEVVKVLMGTSSPNELTRNIQAKIEVDQEKARAITERVNEEIFQKVISSLEFVYGTEGDLQSTTSPSTNPLQATSDLPTMPSTAPWPPVPPPNTPLQSHRSEAPIEIQPPEQEVVLEKAPDIAPENLPTEKDVDSFFLKLILKVATPDTEPLHPFEEKMKMAFTATPTETGNIALAPLEKITTLAQILPDQNLGDQAPPKQTNTPSIPPAPATRSLHHDAYREAVE